MPSELLSEQCMSETQVCLLPEFVDLAALPETFVGEINIMKGEE